MWDERNSAAELMKSDPTLLQLAIFTVSVSAYEVLKARGVQPDLLVGHSFGEIAALTCANVYSIEQGAEIKPSQGDGSADGPTTGGGTA